MSAQKNHFPEEKNFAKFFSPGQRLCGTSFFVIFTFPRCYFFCSLMAKKLGVATEKKKNKKLGVDTKTLGVAVIRRCVFLSGGVVF